MTGERVDARRRPIDSLPLRLWGCVALATVVVRSLAAPGAFDPDRWESLARWSSSTHLELAERGYQRGSDFVLPGYAAVVRALTWLTGGHLTTAVLVSYASSAAASWLFWQWMVDRGIERRARVVSLLVLLVFPYSFILHGAVAADGLVLALVLAAFLSAERDRPVLVGVAVAAAVLTQVTALAIVPALVVMARSDRRPAARRSAVAASVGALVAIVGLSTYLAAAVDDPWWPWRGDGALAGTGTGFLAKGTWIRLSWLLDDTPLTWTLHRGAQAACMLATVVAAYWVAKRFGAGVATFVVGVALTTLVGFADTASSGPRLTLAFPLAALAGGVLARRSTTVAVAALGVASGLMTCCYVLFVRGVGLPYW